MEAKFFENETVDEMQVDLPEVNFITDTQRYTD
jgi:hypothetical protein